VKKTTIDLISTPYTLSQNWEDKHKINVKTEDLNLKETVNKCLNTLKLKKIEMMISDIQNTLKTCTDEEEILILLSSHQKYDVIKTKLSDPLGRIITK
jgi:DNA primase